MRIVKTISGIRIFCREASRRSPLFYYLRDEAIDQIRRATAVGIITVMAAIIGLAVFFVLTDLAVKYF